MKDIEVYKLLFDIADVLENKNLTADEIRTSLGKLIGKWCDNELTVTTLERLENSAAQIKKDRKFMLTCIGIVLLVIAGIIAFFPIVSWYLEHIK